MGQVQLKPDDEAGIDHMVASGRYASREAVVAEGLRLVREQEAWLEMVKAKVEEGRADAAAGRVRSMDDVFDELEARFAQR